jgi:hypothetical protein
MTTKPKMRQRIKHAADPDFRLRKAAFAARKWLPRRCLNVPPVKPSCWMGESAEVRHCRPLASTPSLSDSASRGWSLVHLPRSVNPKFQETCLQRVLIHQPQPSGVSVPTLKQGRTGEQDWHCMRWRFPILAFNAHATD